MTSTDQEPPASTPPQSSSSIPIQPPAASGARGQILTVITTVGSVVLLVSGAFAILADWLTGWHLTRPWSQVSGTFIGALLLVGVAIVPTLTSARRIVMAVGGLLLLLAVADSVDGAQDFLPVVTVLLMVWALGYADTSAQLLQAGRPPTTQRWFAVSLGVMATGVYLSTAAYYFIINLTTAPVDVDHHLLFGLGIVIATLLRWIGDIPPYGGPLSGPVRVCAVCGLPNIAERQTCKRCRAGLGPIERV